MNTVLASCAVLGLALWLPVLDLARITSGIMLAIFATVNISLIVIRRVESPASFALPIVFPFAGAASCVCLLGVQVFG